MVSEEKLIKKIHTCGLKSCHIVNYSERYIKSTQASQWINFRDNGRGLSKAVVMMLWMMCERLEGEKSLVKDDLDLYENGSLDDPKIVEVTDMDFTTHIGWEEVVDDNVNSFLVTDKINVMAGSFIRKSNGVYFNVDGSIYLNEDFDKICIFKKDGKEMKVEIGSGSFGKWSEV